MQKWWKKPKLLGTTAYWIIRSLIFSLRLKINKHPAIDPDTPYLFAFWHGKQFLPPILIKHHNTSRCAMVSPSRDGAILAVFLEKFGYTVIRGSSRDSGTRALLQMKHKLEQGASIGFGIDGPIGPLHVVKPGIVFLAQKCQIKIIPVGSAFSRYWTFNKAWDKFQVPKPFAKAALVLGEPVAIMPEDDLQNYCVRLEEILHQTEQQAIDLIK